MPPFLFAPSRITTWGINLLITLSFTITWVIKTIITILFLHCKDILLGFFFSYVTSGSNLVPLCWSCVLVRHVYNNTDLCNDAQWNRLVAVQCLVLYGVLSAGTAPVCASARKKLHKVWREVWFTLLICIYWYVISSERVWCMMPPPQASQWLSLGTDLPWVETIEKCLWGTMETSTECKWGVTLLSPPPSLNIPKKVIASNWGRGHQCLWYGF